MIPGISAYAPPHNSHLPDTYDRDNPRSVYNLVPAKFQLCMDELESQHPEWIKMSEEDLSKEIFHGDAPKKFENMLRYCFWAEYNRSQINQSPFQITSVYSQVCAPATFYKYITQPKFLAWLLCKPAEYMTLAQEALGFNLGQIRDILSIPHVDKKGQPNTRLIEIKLKCFALLDARVNGALIQRIEQKNMNLNISASERDVHNLAEQMTLEQIDERIKQLSKKHDPLIPDLELAEE